MKITAELSEEDLRKHLLTMFQNLMPEQPIKLTDIHILVKSARNYKAEWEAAKIKATLDHTALPSERTL